MPSSLGVYRRPPPPRSSRRVIFSVAAAAVPSLAPRVIHTRRPAPPLHRARVLYRPTFGVTAVAATSLASRILYARPVQEPRRAPPPARLISGVAAAAVPSMSVRVHHRRELVLPRPILRRVRSFVRPSIAGPVVVQVAAAVVIGSFRRAGRWFSSRS